MTHAEGVEPALHMRGVSRSFHGVPALGGIDLTVAPGEVVALLGPNGSGKTTLARVAAGELAPDRGHVTVSGANPHDPAQVVAARRAVAYVPATGTFYENLTVREHLELVGMGHGVPGLSDRVDHLLDTFGLTKRASAFPDALSTGLRQKTQLAAAFIRPMDLLLLDEPVANLDRDARDQLTQSLQTIKPSTATVIITHQRGFAAQLATNGVILNDGVVVERGPLDELEGW